MAKKGDNTFLWIAALGIGGYLYWQYTQNQNAAAAVPAASNTTPGASGGILNLPPSPVVNTNAGSSAVPAAALPVNNAPSSLALDMQFLIPADQVAANPTLRNNPALAIAPNGLPITDKTGMPLAFAPALGVVKPTFLAQCNGADILMAGPECL